MTKVLALYLPQFHRIPENDKWWGEGFTEWNVVKAAKKVDNHCIQPRVPEMGYYDLSNVNDIRAQVKLANDYGVDGFVIYSYYSRGNTLLEKPAQIILENPDINISYCFSWANHDWMRTWFSYNREMLRKQEYAICDDEIKAHFEYLLPYFKDSRYLKNDNRPVVCIYDYESIPNFALYKQIWNTMAMNEGYNGVFFVQTLGGQHLKWNKEIFDACFDFEPTYTTFLQMKTQHFINRLKRVSKKIFKSEKLCNLFDYPKVCELMEKRVETDPNHLLGFFSEWDNTPRHSHNGTVFKNFSIERFENCFRAQLKKSMENNKPYLIIDAWNEWGEGAYLEPDNHTGLRKLETIRKVKVELGSLI